MKVLYISQYFSPEIGATQTRAFEMAKGLVRNGHQVTVITEFPNHPTGIIPDDYHGKLINRIQMDGIDVIQTWVKASPAKDFRSRLAFYLSFMVMAIWAGLFVARNRFDVLYISSPPLFVGGTGLILRILRRIPMVFEIRDLWPQSAIELGQLRNPRAIYLATWLEEKCYRKSVHLIVVTEGIRNCLLDRGVPANKMTFIPNGANTEVYQPRGQNRQLRNRLGLGPDVFVVGYTGHHGLAHGLETILLAAEQLKDRKDIFFLFVGDGPRKQSILELTVKKKLINVILHDAVSEESLPDFIALLNVGIDSRIKSEISNGTLPVKMFSYMACERAVILAIEGEAADLVQRSNAGLVVEPQNPTELAEAVLFLKDNPDIRREFGRNGREFVKKHYSRRQQAQQLENLLSQQLAS